MVHPNSLETEVPTLDHFQILYYAPLPLLFICTLNRILHNKLAVIFLTALQTLISFHSESQDTKGMAAAEPVGAPFSGVEPRAL